MLFGANLSSYLGGFRCTQKTGSFFALIWKKLPVLQLASYEICIYGSNFPEFKKTTTFSI